MEDSLDEAILTICLCDLRLCHIYGMAHAELLCECCLYVIVSAYIDSMYLSWCLLRHWHLPVYLKMLPVCDSTYFKKIYKKLTSDPESLSRYQTLNHYTIIRPWIIQTKHIWPWSTMIPSQDWNLCQMNHYPIPNRITHIRPWIIIPLSNPESLHHHQTMNHPDGTHMTLIHWILPWDWNF